MNRRNFLKVLAVQLPLFLLAKEAHGFSREKEKTKIILTIDDSPRKTMKDILEKLGPKDENPAIFYVLGKNLKGDYAKSLAKKALINGHVLGNHSYNHLDFSKIDFENAKKEVQETERLIEKLHQEVDIPKRRKLFRFPYGKEDTRIRTYLKEQGYCIQRWDVDSEDWAYRSEKNKLNLIYMLLKCEEVKDRNIVLVHDLQITSDYLIPFFVHSGRYKLVLPQAKDI